MGFFDDLLKGVGTIAGVAGNPLLGGALALGGTVLGGLVGSKTPEFELSSSDINSLIDAFRSRGMEGLRQLGQQERQRATSRLAASGLAPTPALQSALFTPILESLSGARAGLEGQLAGTQANLQLARAGAQFQGDLQSRQNLTSLFGGIGDIGGLLLLRQLFGNNTTTPNLNINDLNDFNPNSPFV